MMSESNEMPRGVKGESFKEQKKEVKKERWLQKDKQNETEFQGRMKKDDAMREQHNISENEKKKKDG
jgi:hypothetical protein